MISQPLNALYGVPLTGDAATAISFHKISARINPASTAAYLGSGMAVKLIAGTPAGSTDEILVDAISAATDKVYGTIFYNMKRNLHKPGDVVEVVIPSSNSIVWLEPGAAITRGQYVKTSPADGTVSPAAAGERATGVALTEAVGAGKHVRVQIESAVAA